MLRWIDGTYHLEYELLEDTVEIGPDEKTSIMGELAEADEFVFMENVIEVW